MTLLKVRNWSEFQHYKDRNPPWIKLHFSLLSSADWVMLDDASKLLAVVCMLIASRKEGQIDGSEAGLAYIQRVAYLSKKPNIKPLIECGFLEDASGCKQMLADARPEERQRRDRGETETDPGASAPLVRINGKHKKSSLPDGFGESWSDSMKAWLEKRGETQVKAHLIHFVGYAKANGKQYADWEQAFQNAIREDWAKIRRSDL